MSGTTNGEKKETVDAVDATENKQEEDDDEEDIDRFPPEQEAVRSQ